MSAPFIDIPQTPVAGHARDFLDEFNRVAADPNLGASLEQLEKGAREFATKPADLLLVEDLVAKLINDNKALWDKLLQNEFCQKHMKTQPSTDKATADGFKWYMRQDFLYIVNLCQYEADRGLKTTNAADFGTSMDKVGSRATYAKDLLKTCITAPPTGLGIKDSDVISTRATKALTQYISFLVETATTQNWVMSMVGMVPCVQSYYLIAVDLEKNSAHKDTPWYKLWVQENVKYKASTEKQRTFFVSNANLWKDHYDVANKIFQRACQAEIDLWGTALHPGVA